MPNGRTTPGRNRRQSNPSTAPRRSDPWNQRWRRAPRFFPFFFGFPRWRYRCPWDRCPYDRRYGDRYDRRDDRYDDRPNEWYGVPGPWHDYMDDYDY